MRTENPRRSAQLDGLPDRLQRLERVVERSSDESRLIPQHPITCERGRQLRQLAGLGREHVDACVAVHLQVDEPGDRQPAPLTRKTDLRHQRPRERDVATQQGAVDDCRCYPEPHRSSLRRCE